MRLATLLALAIGAAGYNSDSATPEEAAWFDSAKDGNLAKMKELHAAEAFPAKFPDWMGQTALDKAAFNNHFEMAEWLIVECGLDPTVVDSQYKQSALHLAASKGAARACPAVRARVRP